MKTEILRKVSWSERKGICRKLYLLQNIPWAGWDLRLAEWTEGAFSRGTVSSYQMHNVTCWTYGERFRFSQPHLLYSQPHQKPSSLSQNTFSHQPATKPAMLLTSLVWNTERPAKMQTCSGKRSTRLYQVCLAEVAGSFKVRLPAMGIAASNKWGWGRIYILQIRTSAEHSMGFFSYGASATPYRWVG